MIVIPEVPALPGEKKNLSGDYAVTVNGLPCEVRAARVSAMPFNRVWPGKQRDIAQSELASFIMFSSDEPVTVGVKCLAENAGRPAVIRPVSKGYSFRQDGDTVTIEMKENGFLVLELGDEHHCLHVFNNPVNEFEQKQKATHYFGPGVHCPGLVRLKSGDSVYIDAGAVVYGSFFGENIENVDIYGYGIIDGSYERRLFEHCYERYTKGNLKFYESRNIRIEGVTLMDSAIWVINLFACENVTVEGVKVIGQWRYNTDGVDIVNSSHVTVKDSFIRVFDDVVTLKGIRAYQTRPVTDILVENCVFWCGWGRTCEVGIETMAPEYTRIVFRNCDLIRNSTAAIDLRNGNFADIHDVLFEDLRVEYAANAMPEVYQTSDEQTYAPARTEPWMPALIWTDNFKYHPVEEEKPGVLRDIVFRNIQVYAEEGLPAPTVYFLSTIPAPHRNFTLDGLFVNGKRITSSDELDYVQSEYIENVVLI